MKKKTLIPLLCITIAISAFFIYKDSYNVMKIVSVNIESLANNESGGTNVDYCYFSDSGGSYSNAIYCDSRTSNSTIYPCPSKKYDWKTESKRDRCTK